MLWLWTLWPGPATALCWVVASIGGYGFYTNPELDQITLFIFSKYSISKLIATLKPPQALEVITRQDQLGHKKDKKDQEPRGNRGRGRGRGGARAGRGRGHKQLAEEDDDGEECEQPPARTKGKKTKKSECHEEKPSKAKKTQKHAQAEDDDQEPMEEKPAKVKKTKKSTNTEDPEPEENMEEKPTKVKKTKKSTNTEDPEPEENMEEKPTKVKKTKKSTNTEDPEPEENMEEKPTKVKKTKKRGQADDDDQEPMEEKPTKVKKTKKSTNTEDPEPEENMEEKPTKVKKTKKSTNTEDPEPEENMEEKPTKVKKTKKRGQADDDDQEPMEEKPTKVKKTKKSTNTEDPEPEENMEEKPAKSQKKHKTKNAMRESDAPAPAASSSSRRSRRSQNMQFVAPPEADQARAIKKKVEYLTSFVSKIDHANLETDDLKFYIKENLTNHFGHEHLPLNIYWSRRACGVRVKTVDGVNKDPFTFSFSKSGNTKSLQLVVSVAATAYLVLRFWLCNLLHFSKHPIILSFCNRIPPDFPKVMRSISLVVSFDWTVQADYIVREELLLGSCIDENDMALEYSQYKAAGETVLQRIWGYEAMWHHIHSDIPPEMVRFGSMICQSWVHTVKLCTLHWVTPEPGVS